MANQYTDSVGSTSGIPGLVQTAYDRYVEFALRAEIGRASCRERV